MFYRLVKKLRKTSEWGVANQPPRPRPLLRPRVKFKQGNRTNNITGRHNLLTDDVLWEKYLYLSNYAAFFALAKSKQQVQLVQQITLFLVTLLQ